jgi:hypothetical protein
VFRQFGFDGLQFRLGLIDPEVRLHRR